MNDNKKIAVNSIILFVRLVVTSLIGIIASRIVLDALGASDYGLYNVVGGIVTILNVFNSSMVATTYRFIAAEMGRGESGNVNKVFNVSFLIHVAFALVIVLVGTFVGEWYIDNYLNVAEGKLPDARFVFHISIITTAISTLLVPYQGLITSYEKFNVLAIRDILTRILYFVAIYYLLKLDLNRLRIYACIHLAYNVVYNGSFLVYCKHKFTEDSKFKIYREWEQIKSMFSFALWTLFGAVANITKTQGCAILINFFFGTIVNAAYAVANQVESYVLMFARSLNNAAIPQITKSFNGGKRERSLTLTSYISKYTFILMSLVAFPVLLETDFLLGLWLKEVPEGAATFCKLIVLGGLLGTLGEGIPALVNATGNLKVYQLVFHTFVILGLPIAWIFFKLGYNPYTIVIVYCVIYFLSAFVRLFLLKYIYHFDIMQIIRVSYIRIIAIAIPLFVFYILYNPSSFSTLFHIIGMLGAEMFLVIVVLIIGLDAKERNLLKIFIVKKTK